MRRPLAVAGGVVVSTLCLATSAAAQITEFGVPDPDSRPTGITAGPDGALWFTEAGANQIGRITTSGAVTEFNQVDGALRAIADEYERTESLNEIELRKIYG